jgi:zinc protease
MQRHVAGGYPPSDVRYIGTVDEDIANIQTVTVEQLQKFHAAFYGASNGELSVVGDFDPEAVQRIARDHLDGWKSPQRYARVTRPYRKVEPLVQSLETPDKANAMFVAGLPLNINDEHADYPALLFANYLFGASVNSRLFARIRGKEGLSYGVGSGLGAGVGPDAGTFMANAISAPENAAKVEASFRDELATVLRDGFSEAEIADGKKSWLQGQQMNRSQDTALASRLSFMAQHSRTMAWDAELQKRVMALTAADIREAMKRHLDPAAMSVVTGGDFRKANK